MKIENQVTNLELSKKLKNLGVKQESLWYWVQEIIVSTGRNIYSDWEVHLKDKIELLEERQAIYDAYSAFTVAELGEMSPRHSMHKSIDNPGEWIGWVNDSDRLFRDNTEANARAALWIYLIENKLVKETNT